MKQTLTGAYLYTYKAIKKELKQNVVKDHKYKETLKDLFDIFYQLEISKSNLPAEFIDAKGYANSLADGLNIKKHPVLIKSLFISFYSVFGSITIFLLTIFTVTYLSRLDRPIVHLEGNVLSWDGILGADYYIVNVGDDEFRTTETTFEFVPTDYHQPQLYVTAFNSFLNLVSAESNRLNYEITEAITELEYYHFDHYVPLVTDELGYATLRTSFQFGGIHTLSLREIDNIEQVEITNIRLDSHSVFKNVNELKIIVEPYDTYTFRIKHTKNTEVWLLIAPLDINLNQPKMIPSYGRGTYDINYNVEIDSYITLLNYHPQIILKDVFQDHYNLDSTYNQRFGWMTNAIEVYNGTAVNQEIQFTKKLAQPFYSNEDHFVSEINQVQIFKLRESQFSNANNLYIEFDSKYYDLHFMSDQYKKMNYHQTESGIKRITLPIFSQSNIQAVYFILIPKEEKTTDQTRILIHTTKPDDGYSWSI